MSAKSKLKTALAKREPLADVLARRDVQEALSLMIEERMQGIEERLGRVIQRGMRPLKKTSAGVFGDVGVDDLEDADLEDLEAESDRLANAWVDCSVCHKPREANAIVDEERRLALAEERQLPVDHFCWCGYKPEQIPKWE